MKRFPKKCELQTYRHTYRQTDILTDKVIHRGAPLLKRIGRGGVEGGVDWAES